MAVGITTSSASAASGDPAYTRLQDGLERNEMARDLVSGLMARMCPRTDSAPFARWDVTTTPDTEERRKTSLAAFALGIFGWRTFKEEGDIRTFIQSTDIRLLGHPTRIAAEKGNALFLNACMNHPTLTKSQKLILFSAAGDLSRVKALLESEGLISKEDAEQAFIRAAKHNQSKILGLLIEMIGVGDGEGQIPRRAAGWALSCAAARNHCNVITLLLARADLISRKAAGEALGEAAKRNHCDVITLLLARADLISREGEAAGLALIQAAQGNHRDAITLLLARADLFSRETAGEALFGAANRNHCDAITLILDRADLIAGEAADWALREAASMNHRDALTLILDRADLLSREAAGVALREGVEMNSIDALTLLLNRADLISKTAAGNALIQAAKLNRCDAITLLLDRISIGDESNQISKEMANCAIQAAQDRGYSTAARLIQEHIPQSAK